MVLRGVILRDLMGIFVKLKDRRKPTERIGLCKSMLVRRPAGRAPSPEKRLPDTRLNGDEPPNDGRNHVVSADPSFDEERRLQLRCNGEGYVKCIQATYLNDVGDQLHL